MRAGRLRHRVRIEAVKNSVDALGAPQKTWEPVNEVAAEIRGVSGREFLEAGRDLGDELYRIRIRAIPGFALDGTYRAIDMDTDAIYAISAVIENHHRNELMLHARAGGAHP